MVESNNKIDLSKFTFSSGAELSNGEVIMISHPFGMDPEKNPKSVFLIRDTKGSWSNAGSVSWLPEGISSNINEDKIFLTHWGGSCLEFNKTDNTFSNVYKNIIAIASPNNQKSINLLIKLGLNYQSNYQKGNEILSLFSLMAKKARS